MTNFISFWFLFFGLNLLTVSELFKNFKGLVLNFDFFFFQNLGVSFKILLDSYSLLFSYCLFMIVGSVFSFSNVYMKKEKFISRFNKLVLLFVLSMVFLIFMPELLFTLIGWDGLGLSSFLLMIYYLSGSSMSAGMKTYTMKRLGDGFFLMALGILMIQGNWKLLNVEYSLWVSIFLIFGCFTKSAQFPFSSWLPDAMAAPTPVSALVHSSTLVTAGIFLLIRFFSCLNGYFFFILGFVGFWTMLLASLAACVEFDSKKIIAYSTLSQLGLMLVSLSLGLVNFAFFHLLTHAGFKALLFISGGFKIFLKNHFQDVRLLKFNFFSSFLKNFVMTVCMLSLIGFPFLSGFFSKEKVMEGSFWVWNKIFFMSFFLCLPLTSFYAIRLLMQSSLKTWKNNTTFQGEKVISNFSFFPLLILAVVTGFWFSKMNDFLLMKKVSTFFEKFLIFFLVFSGIYFSLSSTNHFSFLYLSELSFLKTFKGIFFIQKFSEKFFLMFSTLDLGLKNSFISFLKTSLKNFSKIFKELSIFFNNLKSKILGLFGVLGILYYYSVLLV